MEDDRKEEFTNEEMKRYVEKKLETNDWILHCIRTATQESFPTKKCDKSNFFPLLEQNEIQAIRLQSKKDEGNEFFSYDGELKKFKKQEKLDKYFKLD